MDRNATLKFRSGATEEYAAVSAEGDPEPIRRYLITIDKQRTVRSQLALRLADIIIRLWRLDKTHEISQKLQSSDWLRSRQVL